MYSERRLVATVPAVAQAAAAGPKHTATAAVRNIIRTQHQCIPWKPVGAKKLRVGALVHLEVLHFFNEAFGCKARLEPDNLFLRQHVRQLGLLQWR